MTGLVLSGEEFDASQVAHHRRETDDAELPNQLHRLRNETEESVDTSSLPNALPPTL